MYVHIPPVFYFFIFCYIAFMGELAKLGWQRMDVLVEAHGADDVLHMVCEQVADGATLSDISKREGVPYSVLWKWLGVGNRMDSYLEALKAKADMEAHRVVEIADGSSPESAVVDKLRIDARKWAVGAWDKDRYGGANKVAVDVRFQVDLAGALEEAEKRRARLYDGVEDAEIVDSGATI